VAELFLAHLDTGQPPFDTVQSTIDAVQSATVLLVHPADHLEVP
jgi:hypothetical protein